MQTLTQHDGKTGELVCYTPDGEEVLRIAEHDFTKANKISAAIQESYKKGSLLGKLKFQKSIEQYMDELNRT